MSAIDSDANGMTREITTCGSSTKPWPNSERSTLGANRPRP